MRPKMHDIWMMLALQLSERSTCSRRKVGAVVTSESMEEVFSVGYNGNARGFENKCDREGEGSCGCLHAEVNALVKAGTRDKKIVFVTMSPCEACAKLMVNANVSTVYFKDLYRDVTGLSVLARAGIKIYMQRGPGDTIELDQTRIAP